MQLNAAASTTLVVFYLILSVLMVVVLSVLVLVLFRLNTWLTEQVARVEPLLDRTEALLDMVNSKVATVGESAEVILSHGEATAATVQDKVETTAATVQRTVHTPLIGFNAVLAGVSQGFSTFSRLQTKQPHRSGNGHRRPSVASVPATPVEPMEPTQASVAVSDGMMREMRTSLPAAEEETPTLVTVSGRRAG